MPEPAATTPTIELYTQRLRLRQWRSEDTALLATMNDNPRVMQHFLKPLSAQESDAFLKSVSAIIALQGWGLWAVEHRQDGAFIGFTGLNEPAFALPFTSASSPCIEISWRLLPDEWGHGYATEAAHAALEFGFTQLHLPEIISFTTLSNHRSEAVMQRLGMQRSENFEHPAVPNGHPLKNHVLYRLTAAAWQSHRRTVASTE